MNRDTIAVFKALHIQGIQSLLPVKVEEEECTAL